MRGGAAFGLLAAVALAACGDQPAGADRDRPAQEPSRAEERPPQRGKQDRRAKRAGANPLLLERTDVGWRRLGTGFVNEGIPLTARVGRSGKLKGKVVTKAATARRLGLWPDPTKMKDRSVAQEKVEVKRGERRTILLKPHEQYSHNFRSADEKVLRDARYELRAVLRDREGRKVARTAKPIAVD